MKKILYSLIFIMVPFICFAQSDTDVKVSQEQITSQTVTDNKADVQKVNSDVQSSNKGQQVIKKVVFISPKRNPFLSQEEINAIEQEHKAKLRRLEEEKQEKLRLAQEAMRLKKQREIEEEEMRRYPARKIMHKIKVEGILGKEAIVNGDVVGVGSVVLGAKVVSITDDSVWFVFEGQRFQKKLPLL